MVRIREMGKEEDGGEGGRKLETEWRGKKGKGCRQKKVK